MKSATKGFYGWEINETLWQNDTTAIKVTAMKRSNGRVSIHVQEWDRGLGYESFVMFYGWSRSLFPENLAPVTAKRLAMYYERHRDDVVTEVWGRLAQLIGPEAADKWLPKALANDSGVPA